MLDYPRLYPQVSLEIEENCRLIAARYSGKIHAERKSMTMMVGVFFNRSFRVAEAKAKATGGGSYLTNKFRSYQRPFKRSVFVRCPSGARISVSALTA